jgi:hypothetical protein
MNARCQYSASRGRSSRLYLSELRAISVDSAQHVRNASVVVWEVEYVNAARIANVAANISQSVGCLGPGGAHCRSSSDRLC